MLGRFNGSLIAAGDRASTLVMSPTQVAGKSSRVVVPALLEWEGPVLTTSIKRDVVDATLPRRQELGQVKVFDQLGRTGMATASWSPVAASATWTQAREVAAHLMQFGWDQPAREVLASLWGKDQGYASSVLATLEEGLDPWQEPSIAQATARPNVTAEWVLGDANTLYVLGGGQDQHRLASLYGALLMWVIDDALSIAGQQPSRRLERPLLCALDELAKVAPIPSLGHYASAGRERRAGCGARSRTRSIAAGMGAPCEADRPHDAGGVVPGRRRARH